MNVISIAGGISDLFKSEKGLMGVAVLVIATVAFFTGKIDKDTWMWLMLGSQATYTVGKTVQGTWGSTPVHPRPTPAAPAAPIAPPPPGGGL